MKTVLFVALFISMPASADCLLADGNYRIENGSQVINVPTPSFSGYLMPLNGGKRVYVDLSRHPQGYYAVMLDRKYARAYVDIQPCSKKTETK